MLWQKMDETVNNAVDKLKVKNKINIVQEYFIRLLAMIVYVAAYVGGTVYGVIVSIINSLKG